MKSCVHHDGRVKTQNKCQASLRNAWWRHQIETFSALLALCAGNSPVTGEFPSQRPVTRSFDVLICAWIKAWVNNRQAGDLRRHGAHYHVIVICTRVTNLVSIVHADIQAHTDTRKTIGTALLSTLDAIFSCKWLVWYVILVVDQIPHKPSHHIAKSKDFL